MTGVIPEPLIRECDLGSGGQLTSDEKPAALKGAPSLKRKRGSVSAAGDDGADAAKRKKLTADRRTAVIHSVASGLEELLAGMGGGPLAGAAASNNRNPFGSAGGAAGTGGAASSSSAKAGGPGTSASSSNLFVQRELKVSIGGKSLVLRIASEEQQSESGGFAKREGADPAAGAAAASAPPERRPTGGASSAGVPPGADVDILGRETAENDMRETAPPVGGRGNGAPAAPAAREDVGGRADELPPQQRRARLMEDAGEFQLPDAPLDEFVEDGNNAETQALRVLNRQPSSASSDAGAAAPAAPLLRGKSTADWLHRVNTAATQARKRMSLIPRNNTHVFLKDLSTYGTYINGVKLGRTARPKLLLDGVIVSFMRHEEGVGGVLVVVRHVSRGRCRWRDGAMVRHASRGRCRKPRVTRIV